jgi:hypothetical protein
MPRCTRYNWNIVESDFKHHNHNRNPILLIWEYVEVHFVLDQHVLLDIYSASSLKQQSADRDVAPLGHIILIPKQPVLALSPEKQQMSIL